MIYEERQLRLQPGTFRDYRNWVFGNAWPALEAAGHRPLCLLNGLIGAPAEAVLFICGFDTAEDWYQAQPLLAGENQQSIPGVCVQSESVQLLSASPYRPVYPAAPADRRPVYGVRRWWIDPENWARFNQLSFEGVWPALDHMGHRVLGQFRHLATTTPLETINLAGYHDVAHWQATRNPAAHGVPADLVERFSELVRERQSLVSRTFVRLMTAHWPE